MAVPVAPLPSITATGVANNPVTTVETAGTGYPLTLDDTGALQVSLVHGERWVASKKANLYRGSSGVAGASVLAPGGTTSGLCFGNASASGVVMDVHRIRVVPLTATAVVSVLGLEYGVAPVSTTYVTGVVGSPIGGTAVPLCHLWSGVTIIAMAWLQALPYFVPATTNINQPGIEYVFNGGMLIAPGNAVNVVSSATTQGGNKYFVEVDWSEWQYP